MSLMLAPANLEHATALEMAQAFPTFYMDNAACNRCCTAASRGLHAGTPDST